MPPVKITGGIEWWRRRDGWSVSFKTGRTMPSSLRLREKAPACGACYPSRRADGSWGLLLPFCNEISRSISLYRAGLKLALFLPLGVALASCDALGFTDVSSVFILPLRTDATSFLIEPASRSYRRPGTTCLVLSFDFALPTPTHRLRTSYPLDLMIRHAARRITITC